jgi:hypothetical protein
MQKHVKARKIRALKIHTKSTNVSSLWLTMSTFRFLPVFRESYNMILNFKTAPMWLLIRPRFLFFAVDERFAGADDLAFILQRPLRVFACKQILIALADQLYRVAVACKC